MPEKQLSVDSTLAIVKAKQSGRSLRDIGRQFGIDHKRILNIYKYINTSSVERKAGSGCPRKTNARPVRELT